MRTMMKHFLPFTFLTLLASAPAALAQNWEVGAGGGGNFYTSQTFTNPAGNAAAKLASGFIVSAWLDNNTSGQFGGELRYDYEHTDLKLRSEEHTSELQSLRHLVCRLLLEKKKPKER